MILHPFRHARREGRPLQVAAAVQHQFAHVGHAQQALDLDGGVGADAQFLHDHAAQPVGRARRDLQPHDLAPAAALQRGLELAHQVLGLVLKLQVAVAQHAEAAMADVPIAGEQRRQVHQQQVFQPHETLPARQGDEPRELGRDRQKRLHLPPVGFPRQFQRQAEAGVGDEGKWMRRVDGQRRQDREHLLGEMLAQEGRLGPGDARSGQDHDARPFHLAPELVPDGLLRPHQAARVGVDQRQLLGGRKAVVRRRGVAFPHQLAQAGDADGVELIEVGGRDRQEAQTLQQGNARVPRLVQHPPVEGQPAEFAVEEAGGPRRRALGHAARWRERALQEIGLGHDRVDAAIPLALQLVPRAAARRHAAAQTSS